MQILELYVHVQFKPFITPEFSISLFRAAFARHIKSPRHNRSKMLSYARHLAFRSISSRVPVSIQIARPKRTSRRVPPCRMSCKRSERLNAKRENGTHWFGHRRKNAMEKRKMRPKSRKKTTATMTRAQMRLTS